MNSNFESVYKYFQSEVSEGDLFIDFSFKLNDDSDKEISIYDVKFGWIEMLIKCERYKVDDFGVTEIFGTPLIVSRFIQPGYGWYEVNGNTSDKGCMYYEFDGEKFTGNIFKYEKSDNQTEEILDSTLDAFDINQLRYRLEFSNIISCDHCKYLLDNYRFSIVNDSIKGLDILTKKIRSCNNLKAFVIPEALIKEK